MNKKFVLLSACLLAAGTMTAQKRVTGHVVDAQGNPVVGAAVKIVGTNILTRTDVNGNFAFKSIPSTAKKIRISYLGMRTARVSVAGNLNVVMQLNNTELGQAVVVGYGTAKKLGTVVGSVSKISGKNIENKPVTTVLDGLQGKVPGVQMLSSTGDAGDIRAISTTVRGVGSLNGGNAPLFVVDGTPVSSSVFYMMNPNDIASYTVLRDASATSIYGSRAANGVIFVTTKKGKFGSEKAILKVSQNFAWSQLARRVGNPMNTAELLDYQFENGIITPEDYARYKASGINTDWQNFFFNKTAPMHTTSFSLQGGGKTSAYYLSASYLKKDGQTDASGFKRYTVRANLDSRPFDWMRMGVNLNLDYDERLTDDRNGSDALYLTSGVLGTMMVPPYINPYDKNGKKIPYTPFVQTYIPSVSRKYSPYSIDDSRLTGNAYLELRPFKGLTLKSQLGLDGAMTRGTSKRMPNAPWVTAAGQGSVGESFSRFYNFTITNTAEYKWFINEDNQLTLLAGQEGIKDTGSGFSSSTKGQSDPRFMTLGNGTVANLPGVRGISVVEYLSFFGRADYTLKNKYFMNFTVRNDRSSRFGKNKRSGTFASGGFMWDAKKENFLSDLDWLTDLKLKTSLGSTGNSAGIGNYQALGLLSARVYDKKFGLTYGQVANPNLTWETQTQFDLGFNARLLDRFNLSLDYYRRLTSDMLMDVPVPYTTGFASRTQNVSSILNQGVELQFDVDAVRDWNGLNVNLYGNFTYNSQKIEKLFGGLKQYIIPGTGVIYIVGDPVKYYRAKRAGIDPADGKIMWYIPGTNKTTKEFDDAKLSQDVGKVRYTPVSGGFGLSATWKGFGLNADFIYVLGKYMIDNIQFFSYNSKFGQQGFNQSRDMRRAWKQPGDVTDIPRFGEQNQFDTSLLKNASFMRLKNLSLTYDLPRQWTKSTGVLSNVRFIASARNLFTLTSFKGADPEVNTSSAQSVFPNTREFSLGAELTF